MIRLVGVRYVLTFAELYLFYHTFILLCAVILQHYVVGSCPFEFGREYMYVCMYLFSDVEADLGIVYLGLMNLIVFRLHSQIKIRMT